MWMGKTCSVSIEYSFLFEVQRASYFPYSVHSCSPPEAMSCSYELITSATRHVTGPVDSPGAKAFGLSQFQLHIYHFASLLARKVFKIATLCSNAETHFSKACLVVSGSVPSPPNRT